MNDIRTKISEILGVRIQEGKWELYVDMLDREGKFTRKIMIAIIMVEALALEELQKENENLRASIESLRQPQPEVVPIAPASDELIKEALYEKRVAAMAKARAARKYGKSKKPETHEPVQPIKA